MRTLIIVFIIFVVLFMGYGMSCSYGNLDAIKDNAENVWENNGFRVIGYQGYQWGHLGCGTYYGGATVWYTLKKISDDKVTYEGAIRRWGKEYHIYNLSAIDAIKPNN